jgi:hypothetical protein
VLFVCSLHVVIVVGLFVRCLSPSFAACCCCHSFVHCMLSSSLVYLFVACSCCHHCLFVACCRALLVAVVIVVVRSLLIVTNFFVRCSDSLFVACRRVFVHYLSSFACSFVDCCPSALQRENSILHLREVFPLNDAISRIRLNASPSNKYNQC